MNPQSATVSAAKRPTKKAQIERMLKRKTGATLDELISVTGWKRASIHGAIATIKGGGGYAIEHRTARRGEVYRIIGPAPDPEEVVEPPKPVAKARRTLKVKH